MNIKKLSILGTILAILIGIILVSENFQSISGNSSKQSFFPGFKVTDCSKLTIYNKEKGAITLFKESGKWLVKDGLETSKENSPSETPFSNNASSINSGYTVDSAAVAIVIEKLTTMKKMVVISKNKNKQAVFKVDSLNGTFVTVYNKSGKAIETFVIGKSGVSWDENYVRLATSNDVYSLPGSLKYSFHLELKKWRDKSIVKLNGEKIKMITIDSKEMGKTVLQNSQNSVDATQWKITEPAEFAVNTEEVAKLIKNITGFSTYEWEIDPSKTDFAMGLLDPQYTLTIITESGKREVVIVGNKAENSSKVYVKSSSSQQPFIVWNSNASKINLSVNDLKIKEVIEFDSTAVIK